MSLRSKILTIMVVPVVVLFAATFALLASRQETTAALIAERHEAALRDAFGQVLVDMTDAESATRGYVLTGESSFLEPYKTGQARLPVDLQALSLLTKDSARDAQVVAQLRVLAYQRLSILQTTQLMAPIDDLTNHTQLVQLMNSGKAVGDQIRDVVGLEETNGARALADRQRHLDATRHLSFLIGIVGMPLSFLASLLLVTLFTQRLVNRIRRTEEIARMLDEGMPLGEPSASDDELGRLERVLVSSGTRVVELRDELRRMGTADALTRLMNRRGFLPTAEHHLEVAKRNHEPMALMFLDLDGLKNVNDTIGHATGDGMITEAAYVMRQTFRASDLIARMGGDEFCILFAATSEAATREVALRLQEAIDVVNEQEGRPFVLAMSVGIAMFDPEQPVSLDKLMAVADERMYRNKREKTQPNDVPAHII
ncbi:MAG: diguanylate cyclase domain-containing protein [Actinomycetota bacterium]